MYTPYAGEEGMLLDKNGKLTIGNSKSSLLSEIEFSVKNIIIC